MIVLILNIVFFFILLIYPLLSRRRGFYLFSPFCFPFIIFSVYYLLPSTINILIQDIKVIKPHHILYFSAIAAFLSGVAFSRISGLRRGGTEKESPLPDRGMKIPLFAFLFAGAFLLLIYGLWSGVTMGLVSGADIEDLRRTAEVGKGFIKEPGIYLLSLSGLWLTGFYVSDSKKTLFGAKGILIMLSVSASIFLTVGHKSATLLPLLILIGMYNKLRRISVFKMFAIGCAFIALIGALNVARGGLSKEDASSSLTVKTFALFMIYEANYIPIVEMVHSGEMDFQNGGEYLQSAVMFVPRFIYPDKPVSFDYFLKEKLKRRFEGGGLPPTPVGSLYLNFGFAGVVFGMILIGFIYDRLFKMYLYSSYSKAVIALYLMYNIMNPSQFFWNFIMVMGFVFLIAASAIIMHKGAGYKKAAPAYPGEAR